jgi:hypothetical protein
MRGLGIIVYGSEGIGKTTFALRFPGPIDCLSVKETGYDNMAPLGMLPENITNYNIDSYEEVLFLIKKTKAKTLVLDSLSGLQQLLFNFVCRTHYDGNWEAFTSYWKGQRVDSPAIFQSLLDECNEARARGVHIVLIGHMITIEMKNSMGPDYMCHALELDGGEQGGVCSVARKWAQAILFMNIDISINRIEKTDSKTKTILSGKARDTEMRIMYTTKSTNHSAKNQLDLPPVIALGESSQEAFNNFWKHIHPIYKEQPTS